MVLLREWRKRDIAIFAQSINCHSLDRRISQEGDCFFLILLNPVNLGLMLELLSMLAQQCAMPGEPRKDYGRHKKQLKVIFISVLPN
jgi:hypothetical protein